MGYSLAGWVAFPEHYTLEFPFFMTSLLVSFFFFLGTEKAQESIPKTRKFGKLLVNVHVL